MISSPIPGASTRKAARHASRWRPHANRSRRSSMPARVRSCSPRRAPRRSRWRFAARSRKHRGHVVTTAVEHSAVRETIEALDVEWTSVPVDGLGRYDAAAVEAAMRPRHRARLGAAGQPRSGHGATGGRRLRAGSGAGRADTRRRVRGDRPHARVVRRARCRPVLGDRTQVGRSERCGRVARAPRPAHPAAHPRRRAGTGPARGHRRCRRVARVRRRVRRGRRRSGSRRANAR